MSLSNDLIAQFVKITNDTQKKNTETTVYGTAYVQGENKFVKIDGSNLNTPIASTTNVKNGDRVTVMIKNHTAIVTGNLTSPAPRTDDVADATKVAGQITELEILVADKVSSNELAAESARINNLITENVTIKQNISANSAGIKSLQADNVTINNSLAANSANITKLETEKLDAETADLKYATIENLEATNADIYNLEATYGEFVNLTGENFEAANAEIEKLKTNNITTEYLKANYANIDFSNIGKAAMEYFYSQSGLIENVVVGDQTITGKLVGVTISGDLIIANTLKADKLVIKGSDGLYYKLNTDGVKVETEQTDSNSLNGSIIKAKSITATKIAVDDLVAFDATIGGFNISEESIFSGVKETVDNTTRGIYLDKNGQFNFGDSDNFLKFYKDGDTYKLAISADSIMFGADKKTIEQAIDDIKVSGRNLLLNSKGNTITGWTVGGSILDDDEKSKCVVRSTTSTAETFLAPPRTSKVEPSTEYTFSCDIFVNEYVKSVDFYWLSDTETDKKTGTQFVNATYFCAHLKPTVGIWQRVNATFTTNADDYTGFIRIDNNGSTTEGSAAILKVANLKLEKGNKATEWTPAPEDIQNGIDDAAKTATNFMQYDSTGLQIGNKSSGSWSGFRTQITSTAFNILDAAGTVLASYGAKLIELGKNATDAVIKFCGGKGQIEYDSDEDFLQVTGENLRLKGSSMASLYTNYYDGSHTAEKSSVNSTPQGVHIFAEKSIDIDPDTMSGNWDDAEVSVTPDGVNILGDNVSVTSRYGTTISSVSGDVTIDPLNAMKVKKKVYVSNAEKTAYNDGVQGWYIGEDGTLHGTRSSGCYIGFHYGTSKDTTSYIRESKSGTININGMDFGTNKALWNGGAFMSSSQTATLSESISTQTNGIVLVWSYYTNGKAEDYNFHFHFIPKWFVKTYAGKGADFSLSNHTGNILAHKYLYISDTKIVGNDYNSNNNVSGTYATYINTAFVLRAVIGV